MKDIHSKEQIEEMRKRLYDRGSKINELKRHQLTDITVDVSRSWGDASKTTPNTSDLREGALADTENIPAGQAQEETTTPEEKKPRRHYRSFILIGSLLIFIFVAGLSSLYLYFGGNQISSENLQLSIEAPSTVGGGEVLEMQVGVTNQNSVPIESVTLIMRYPEGTLSAGDTPRSIFEERVPIDDIAPGETVSVPVRVAIFGEENARKEIGAKIEYRVNGSNGVFYKESTPLAFSITSSPLVLSVRNIEKVASGQLVDVTVTAKSNGSTPLKDLLVTASYPTGFDFESSTPDPVFAENVWLIDELLPEESKSIKIRGIARGLTDEAFRINFAAGPQNTNQQFSIGASLAESRADFIIERPFIDVVVDIGNQAGSQVVLDQDDNAPVSVVITNTLNETVYDMAVEVVPGGNALDENSVRGDSGFYDSNTETVRWEVANNKNFAVINPGDKRTLNFSIKQGQNKSESSFDLIVNVYARRVAETSAVEQLIGTALAEGKYSSQVSLGSQAARSVAGFGDVGPVPPQVGETTTYTLTLVAEAGVNDLKNAVVETSLPLYVNWLDEYETEGTVTYNTVSKKLQWVVGDIPKNERKELTFQVNIRPSTSQVGTAPVLINSQSVRANDTFTGALLQDDADSVTTELSTEFGFEKDNGEVQR